MGFGQGLITGFAEQVTEDIQAEQKRGREYVTKMRDSHVARARADREKRAESFEEVEEALDKLAGLSFVNANYDRARQVYASLGRSPEAANQFVTTTVPTAEAFARARGEELDWNTAIKFAETDPTATPITRLEAINSFVKGRQGVYTGTIADAQVPTAGWLSLLGDTDKDMQKQITEGLAAEGFKLGDDVPLGPVMPAKFDYTVLRPDLVLQGGKAQADIARTEQQTAESKSTVLLNGARGKEIQTKLNMYDKTTQAQIESWAASAASSRATAESTRAKLADFQKNNPQEQALKLKLLSYQITREATGTSAEAGYTFAGMREAEINSRIEVMDRNQVATSDPEWLQAQDDLKQIRAFQVQIAGQLDSDRQTEIFSKMSPASAFNMYYEASLQLLTDVKFTPGLEGRLASVQIGDKLKGIRAFTSAKRAFNDAFSKVPNFQAVVGPMIKGFETTINQGADQYLASQVSAYSIGMAADNKFNKIQTRNLIDANGKPVPQHGLMAYDAGKKGEHQVLFAVNPKNVTTVQKAAQDEQLAQMGIDPAKLPADDPTTKHIDESIVFVIYAGNGEWVTPSRM